MGIGGKEFTVYALVDRPEHSAVLGRIFTSWSIIESVISGILAILMDAPGPVTVELLSTFSNNRTRVEAVRKVAKRVLKQKDLKEFDALMKDALDYAEKRNQVAHHLWGKSDDDTTVIYRMPMKALSHIYAYLPGEIPREVSQMHKDETVAFTVQQLEEIEEQGAKLLGRLMKELTKLMSIKKTLRTLETGMPES